MSRPDKKRYYLDIAIAVSARSTCLIRHYGAVIVKDDVIIATGYNGSPRGDDNCCDVGECKRAEFAREGKHGGYDLCPAVHAEQNAIIAAKKSDLIGSTLYLACLEGNDTGHGFYCNHLNPTPCKMCLAMIKNAGITRVVTFKGDDICL